MEQRLFLAACVMYAFTLVSRWLKKQDALSSPKVFGWWHGVFVLLILSCAFYVFSFIAANSGTGEGLSVTKQVIGWVVIAALALRAYFKGLKASDLGQAGIIKKNLEWSNTVYFAGFVASIVMFFFVQAFKIPSASMQDTLLEGDHLFVNKASYGFRVPLTQLRFLELFKISPDDVVVFTFPAEVPTQVNCGGLQYGRDFVKRVIGMPGDKVEVRNAQVFINDLALPRKPYEKYDPVKREQAPYSLDTSVYQGLWEGRRLEEEFGLSLRDNFGPVFVPFNSYFVMGDNRDNSCDSRFWGPVPRENVKGKAWFIHWPLSRISWIR